jgi:CubicO group peptidase (beta-lactamase class C family)
MWGRSISTSFAAIAVMVVVAAAAAAQDVPDTPAGRLLSEFVEAFNSNDQAQWHSFASARWIPREDSAAAVERRVRFFKEVYSDLGGMTIVELAGSTDTTESVIVQAVAPSGTIEFALLTIYISPDDPKRVAMIDLQPAEDPALEIPQGEVTDQQLAVFLTDYLQGLAEKDQFSGAVLVAKDGEPVFARAYGHACKRYDVPNRLDTKFNLGSMNKMFTGVAIAQLVEKGLLSFNDPVGRHLPDFPNKDVAENVTIHHLLTHTSGLPSYWEEPFERRFWTVRTVSQLADLVVDKKLLFRPGEKFEYSNVGPVVLGMIIEKVTGQDFYEYIRENVYKPAGMANSDCYAVDVPVRNLAIGYTRSGYDGEPLDEWRNNLFMHFVRGGPAGGGYSTVEDLLAFDRAMRSHQLLSAAMTDTVITGKTQMGPEWAYAYLFGDRTANGHRVVGHNGGAPGISAVLDMYWDSGYTVAVLANYDQCAGKVARMIERLLVGEQP